jgi:hypothetical protein
MVRIRMLRPMLIAWTSINDSGVKVQHRLPVGAGDEVEVLPETAKLLIEVDKCAIEVSNVIDEITQASPEQPAPTPAPIPTRPPGAGGPPATLASRIRS